MKRLLLYSLLLCAAVLPMTACSEVGTAYDSSQSGSDLNSDPSSDYTEDVIPADEKPTDRVPDIQTTDSFEYEIIDGSSVITGYTGSSADVLVPTEIGGAPVTKIGSYAFEAEYDITSVTLPDSIVIIGEGAFMDCSSLTEINIPSAVEGIDRGAFVACTSLGSITIPESVKYIREEAFTACEAMTSCNIENPDLAYENWGFEELPELVVHAPEGSAAAAWAESIGKLG